MFVYLIIAIELAVLYVAFWIVFLRQPRPREVRAELWGSYFRSTDLSANKAAPSEQTSPLVDEKQLAFYALPSILASPRSYSISKMKKARRKRTLIRRSSKSYWHCRFCSRTSPNLHVLQPASLTQQASRPLVEKFLLSLNRVLNKLSVKVP